MWSITLRHKMLYVLQVSLVFFKRDIKFIQLIRTDHPKIRGC